MWSIYFRNPFVWNQISRDKFTKGAAKKCNSLDQSGKLNFHQTKFKFNFVMKNKTLLVIGFQGTYSCFSRYILTSFNFSYIYMCLGCYWDPRIFFSLCIPRDHKDFLHPWCFKNFLDPRDLENFLDPWDHENFLFQQSIK